MGTLLKLGDERHRSEPQVIPEAAVEAARAAVRAAMIEFGPDGHTDGDEEITRAALEAAAPHMLAECWDAAIEAHKEWTWDDENIDPLTNPYRSQS